MECNVIDIKSKKKNIFYFIDFLSCFLTLILSFFTLSVMKINILTIGNFKNNGEYQKIFDEYKKRIPWSINLYELKNCKSENINERIEREGEELLKNITKGHKVIVLDERGKNITTHEFRTICDNFFENSVGIDFIIGGSDGLSQKVRDKADFILSFGKMVFPHLMVRVMLIEQIYRVFTIKIGHPYHK